LDQISPSSGERKIISRAASGGSSFAGIPSTSSESGDFSTGVSSVSAPSSAATLRRLRDKTGLRTMRKTTSGATDDHGGTSRGRLIPFIIIGGLLAMITVLSLYLAFR
jgi:hypothetical protein